MYCSNTNIHIKTIVLLLCMHNSSILAKLKEKPTHKMLSRITDILTADWRRIGYELLEPKYVKNIESTTKQNEEKCLDMLIKWLETDTSASYSKLIEAFIECNLLNAAEKIKEKASKQL